MVQQEIRDVVMKLTSSKVMKGFYPSHIAKKVKATPQEIQSELFKLTEEGILAIQYELICPQCYRTLEHQENPKDFKSEYDCSFCGEEIEEVMPSYIQVRFLNNRHS